MVYGDGRTNQVKKIELETGKKEIVATVKPEIDHRFHISFSSDLQSAAANVPLQLTPEGGKLKIIYVNEPSGQGIDKMSWSDDGSKLFVAYSKQIEVLDAQGKKIGGGALPKGTSVIAGWFVAGPPALVLHLAKEMDEPDRVIKCSIADWKCSRIKSRVDSASVGGRELFGTVGPLEKPRVIDDDSTALYSIYAAELRDKASRLLARQVFHVPDSRGLVNIFVAPSARKAVVTLGSARGSECAKQENKSSACLNGLIVDLTKVVE